MVLVHYFGRLLNLLEDAALRQLGAQIPDLRRWHALQHSVLDLDKLLVARDAVLLVSGFALCEA